MANLAWCRMWLSTAEQDCGESYWPAVLGTRQQLPISSSTSTTVVQGPPVSFCKETGRLASKAWSLLVVQSQCRFLRDLDHTPAWTPSPQGWKDQLVTGGFSNDTLAGTGPFHAAGHS